MHITSKLWESPSLCFVQKTDRILFHTILHEWGRILKKLKQRMQTSMLIINWSPCSILNIQWNQHWIRLNKSYMIVTEAGVFKDPWVICTSTIIECSYPVDCIFILLRHVQVCTTIFQSLIFPSQMSREIYAHNTLFSQAPAKYIHSKGIIFYFRRECHMHWGLRSDESIWFQWDNGFPVAPEPTITWPME